MKRVKKIFSGRKNRQGGVPSQTPAGEKPKSPVDTKPIATPASRPPPENHAATVQGSGVKNKAVSKRQSEENASVTARPSESDSSIPSQVENKPVVSNGNSFKAPQSTLSPHDESLRPVEQYSDHSDSEEEESDYFPDSKNHHKGVSESFRGLADFDLAEADAVGEAYDGLHASLGAAYDAIKLLEITKLPRGGLSIETAAVGRVQFGIPPETIKDSMQMGIPVPQVYIVPAERFCREMGPALGVNLAEFEFPAYFNFFVYKKRCTLVVDSQEAQDNICRVFRETLLGPAQFWRGENSITHEEEDFAPDFPRDAIPNFEKELKHFRIMPDGSELRVEALLDFCLFKMPKDGYSHNNLGVPRNVDTMKETNNDKIDKTSEEEGDAVEEVSKDANADRYFKNARWVGDIATVWPANATEEEKKNRSVPRVEIFKLPSATEYIIHDIDENNHIIGKARFSGHVKVSESMSVEGFGDHSILDDIKAVSDANKVAAEEKAGKDDDSYDSDDVNQSQMLASTPPTFCPPSFGVTVLGNSHGFDKNGSVSGYVLWINGRGVMIDPPPYASATLEREGIRPRTIVGIILTHCHADHDAGAFQKVLTGSPVVVITTPTIYKSFIRKYSALASLSPALLQHSHRYKPAIIGQPLRFQGATFHFTYALHTIPCVGFRVEWRGRSMVFTGDHMNQPDALDKLQEDGVLSKARADDLRNLPLQETDLLLHEAGAPPIHTPLEVLVKLPQRVKKRLYVVHTSSIPEDCELRVAPTGTAGTLRLDQLQKGQNHHGVGTSIWVDRSVTKPRNKRDAYSISLEDGEIMPSPWSSASNEYGSIDEAAAEDAIMNSMNTSFHLSAPEAKKHGHRSSISGVGDSQIPLVSVRPASSTDAWFILNLLSAVPFLSSLSYASTMEVLETARVDAYCKNDVVVPVSRRNHLLCVVWEGTCVERNRTTTKQKQGERALSAIDEQGNVHQHGAVWHAGDWTGPISMQPDKRMSGESELSSDHDIVAVSSEGVKVITVEFTGLHNILTNGSELYRKYLDRKAKQQRRLSLEVGSEGSKANSTTTHKLLTEALTSLNVLELLDENSALRKLTAVQKRHLESLAEGPYGYGPGERLWRSGARVDKAFLVVSGTASFVPRRRNAGSASVPTAQMGLSSSTKSLLSRLGDSSNALGTDTGSNVGEEMKKDVQQAVEEMGEIKESDSTRDDEGGNLQLEALFGRSSDRQPTSMTEAHDFAKLSKNLQQRAEVFSSGTPSDASVASSQDGDSDSEHFVDDVESGKSVRRRSSRARFANKVLGRLYSRRAFTGGLVFSRGHFLGDVSKMVAGLLSADYNDVGELQDKSFPAFGFGDQPEGTKNSSESLIDMVIHEQDSDSQGFHSSTLTAGKDGCVVLIFRKSTLLPFLDEYPGLLLSLLGTQVVV